LSFKFQIIFWIVSIPIIVAFNVYHTDAQPQEVNPGVVHYHLELAEGIIETCYTRDPMTQSYIPNPALPIVSDLASSCEEKMQSLDEFLAEFVDDEDGRLYEEYLESQSEPQSSEEQALTPASP
jgi:hypothetical protein